MFPSAPPSGTQGHGVTCIFPPGHRCVLGARLREMAAASLASSGCWQALAGHRSPCSVARGWSSFCLQPRPLAGSPLHDPPCSGSSALSSTLSDRGQILAVGRPHCLFLDFLHPTLTFVNSLFIRFPQMLNLSVPGIS